MSTPTVEIYTKMGCFYCTRAKRLLQSKDIEYTEHDITMGGEMRDRMHERAPNATTVPQVFVGDTHIGGSDELAEAERSGKLDTLLGR